MSGVALVAAVLAGLALASCGSSAETASQRGHDEIVYYGCGACHKIGGVRGADADVGPPLTDFKDKLYIVGRLRLTRQNAVRWIMSPQEIEPQTVMPDLGVTRAQAEAITTYLYGQ
jgi:mono/diheme cytochrome c family protein